MASKYRPTRYCDTISLFRFEISVQIDIDVGNVKLYGDNTNNQSITTD